MWTLASAALAAPDAPPPALLAPDPADLPLQVPREERWASIDARASRTARAAFVVTAAFGVTSTVGLVMAADGGWGDEALLDPGRTLVAIGATGTAVTVPVFLTAVQRSHRSLRERDVYTSGAGTAGAWTVYLSGGPAIPLFLAAPTFLPIWTGAVLAVGGAQVVRDDRARRGAGLPTPDRPWQIRLAPRPDGIELDGTF